MYMYFNDCLQLSVNFGGRFSVNAVIPSNLSFCKKINVYNKTVL